MSAEAGPTLDQRRAGHAWKAVAAARESLGASHQGGYAREAKRLSVRIRTAGLGHSLAFLRAKNGSANGHLLKDLDDWLLRQRRPPGLPADAQSLIEAIILADSTFLQLATDEALAWLQWLTRFAEAELGAGEE